MNIKILELENKRVLVEAFGSKRWCSSHIDRFGYLIIRGFSITDDAGFRKLSGSISMVRDVEDLNQWNYHSCYAGFYGSQLRAFKHVVGWYGIPKKNNQTI